MGLISTLKAILGVGGRTDREGEPSVTVEHEPEASAERAVTESDPDPVTSASEEEPEAETDTGDEEPAADEAAGGEESDESVETITGIGPAYADRLAEVGIETVGELAAADAAEVAEGTDISETRVGDWIEQARDDR